MYDTIIQAKKELLKADHQIIRTLKITRTVDVIKNIIKILLDTYNLGIESALIFKKEKGEINEIPEIPKLRADLVNKIYLDDQAITDFMGFYLVLRKINNAEYDNAREFRRHVTMTAYLDDCDVEVIIDIITDYYNKTKDFIEYVSGIVNGDE